MEHITATEDRQLIHQTKNESLIKVNPETAKDRRIMNKEGRQIYQNNKQLHAVVDLLENDVVKNFFKTQIKSIEDVKLIHMIIDVIDNLESDYFEKFNRNLTTYERSYIIKKLLTDSTVRPEMIQHYHDDALKKLK